MRMGALIAPALIVASGGLFTGAAVESLPKPQPLTAPVVAVESLEGRLMASGVLVAPHYVVTNDHVVRGKHRVMIEHSDGSKTEGVVVWTGIAGGVDAAVVRINERAPVKPAKLRCSLPEVGEPVRVVGNPGAAEKLMEARRLVSAGVVSAPTNTTPSLWAMDATVNPGNSGGPVFDADGNVLGLATGSITSSGVGIGIAAFTASASFCADLESIGLDISVA